MDKRVNNQDYFCRGCQVRYISKKDLNIHIKLTHKLETKKASNPFKCDKCNRTFNSLHNYNQHSKTHAIDDDRKCPFCFKSFKALKHHIRNVHSEKRFHCEQCGKSFGKKHGLDRHLKTHSDDFKSYQCPKCSRLFVEKIQLERHFHVHLKAKKKTKHRCLECQKYFNRRPDLLRHRKTIHQERVYECDLCPDRRFSSKFEVLRHFKTVHLGDKPKRKIPAKKIPIEDIMLSVIEEEPEDNSECSGDVTVEALDEQISPMSKPKMKVILESVEPVENFLQSSVESEPDESTAEYLIEHWEEPVQVITQHNVQRIVQWDCQRCNRTFDTCQRLKLHNIRNHSWKCKLCPKDTNAITFFHRKEDFELHWVDNHVLEPFPDKTECFICLDMFAEKAAMHRHQKSEHAIELPKRIRNANRRSCDLCHEEFKSSTSLRKHQIQVHCDRNFRKCFVCNLQIELFVDFKNHVDTHGNDFVCLVCGGMPFQDSKSLRAHQSASHYRCPEVKRWKCDLCHRNFHCKSLIAKHMTAVHVKPEIEVL